MKYISKVSSLIKEVELKKNPVIIRVNKFNEDSAKKFAGEVAAAHNTGQSVIPVVIDSYGGQVYSLMSMIGSIRDSDLPIATVIEGKAMSCGAILFSFGEEGRRFMDPNATLMIHDVSSMAWGKVEEVKVSAEETDRLNQTVYKMMAQNCGHEDEYFLEKVHDRGHADWFLDAAEAKSHNLANHLRIPTIHIDIPVRIKMK